MTCAGGSSETCGESWALNPYVHWGILRYCFVWEGVCGA